MNPMRRLRSGLLLLAALLVSACADENGSAEWTSPLPFDTVFLTVQDSARSERLLVEVARSEAQRSFGLMQRPSLPDSSGMVFLYDTPQDSLAGFWMFQTYVPLDIAFFDTTGTIVAVLQMQPCPSPNPQACRTYHPGVPYVGALETNQGWFAQRGLGPGARIDLSAIR